MSKLISYPLITGSNQISFLTLPNGFNWYIATAAIDATGYVKNYLVKLEFISTYPISVMNFDHKRRNLAFPPSFIDSTRSYYYEIKVIIQFPPTQHRINVDFTRTFNFSDYAPKNREGDVVYLSTYHTETYRWDSRWGATGCQIEESRLNRDINVWLETVIPEE
jgi:hypothetical protein